MEFYQLFQIYFPLLFSCLPLLSFPYPLLYFAVFTCNVLYLLHVLLPEGQEIFSVTTCYYMHQRLN
jgi:hypothetical protein